MLCDTTSSQDVYIHEVLINKNLAVSTSSDVRLENIGSDILCSHVVAWLMQQLMITGQRLWQDGHIMLIGTGIARIFL